MSTSLPSHKGFAICGTCINREFDPFRCMTCEAGSNYEDESGDIDTIDDLRDMTDDFQ